MPEQKRFFYFMSDDPEPVFPNSPLWNTALPLGCHQQPFPDVTRTDENLTYGEYFEAVTEFIDIHLFDSIANAMCHLVGRTVKPHEICRIHIHLEKHGAFYHPARIVLLLAACRISLVVNLAVSAVGKKTIKNEYRQLKRLANRFSPAWVPNVFGFGRVQVDGLRYVQMFLGEWFEGYHEFHVSQRNGQGATGIRVWDPKNENLFLSRRQAQRIYEQTAMILAAYYGIETFEQIHSWHHAAGDFVVSMHNDEPRVKLITVRRYEPLFNLSGEVDTLETILNTLLIFLLNMSIRLRIDRMDGVGDVAWIDVDVVEGIIHGFFKGLVLQAETLRIPYALIDAFKTFLLHLPGMDIRDIFKRIVHQIDPKNPDLPVIKQNLDLHVETVLSGLRHMETLP
jgi:hypothetical protein